jgi:hypothetical protein
MKTYSKKCAERSSSSDDDRVDKEQPDPERQLNAPVHHQKMMKVIKKVKKRVEQIKINQPILRERLRHKKKTRGKVNLVLNRLIFY